MKRKIFSIAAVAIFVVTMNAYSQSEKLSVDELVIRLIENNYSLKLTAEQTRRAQNDVSLSPMLPSVTANARQSQTTVGTTTNTLGLGASLTWRLFDGMGMFATYQRQRQLLDEATLKEMANLEDLIYQLKNQYYLIVSLNSRSKVARESVELSRRRYQDAITKYDIEVMSGLEMKLAKTDFNADSTALIRQLEAVDMAYISMNAMLNFDYDKRGYVQDSIIISSPMDKRALESLVEGQNTNILLSKKGVEISDLSIKLAKSALYPTLDFTTGYNYNAVNELPASSFKNSNGVNWGFTLGVRIFDGLKVQQSITDARIGKSISDLNVSNVINGVMAAFNNQFINYSNNLLLISLESENADAMRLNLELAMDRYRLGDLSGIDFRNIQQQYLASEDRRINALYLAKSSEISLRVLAGIIVDKL